MATFLTNDQWAQRKGYDASGGDDAMTVYLADNDYPTANALTRFREDAYAIIMQYIDGTPSSDEDDYLENLEYRMVELMIDEEQGRQTEKGRPQYIPRDYLFERDRQILAGIGGSGFNRGVHG